MPAPTYCQPEPVQPAEAAAPAIISSASSATMAAPGSLTAVAPAEFPLPCEPEE